MKPEIKRLVTAAVIAALYAATTMINPLSYGPIQFRISEVFCILPFFSPVYAVGLAIGCLIANIIGPYGIIDIVFGTLATVLAGACTAAIGTKARRKSKIGWGPCVTACLMPVLFNAPIIGTVIAYATVGAAFRDAASSVMFWESALVYGAQVGLGELGVMYILGLPAMRYVLKNSSLRKLVEY